MGGMNNSSLSLALSLPASLSCAVVDILHAGTQSEREEKVSLELSEEILQSMEVGMTFRDYVIYLIPLSFLFILFTTSYKSP